MKWFLIVLGVLGFAWALKTEMPAMKRYIKIERMS
jgi:hypothetical protein